MYHIICSKESGTIGVLAFTAEESMGGPAHAGPAPSPCRCRALLMAVAAWPCVSSSRPVAASERGLKDAPPQETPPPCSGDAYSAA